MKHAEELYALAVHFVIAERKKYGKLTPYIGESALQRNIVYQIPDSTWKEAVNYAGATELLERMEVEKIISKKDEKGSRVILRKYAPFKLTKELTAQLKAIKNTESQRQKPGNDYSNYLREWIEKIIQTPYEKQSFDQSDFKLTTKTLADPKVTLFTIFERGIQIGENAIDARQFGF
jgi:ATP-dependent Lon protease